MLYHKFTQFVKWAWLRNMALALRQSRLILTPALTSLRQWCQTLPTSTLSSRRQHYVSVQYYYTRCKDESTSHSRPLWAASVMGIENYILCDTFDISSVGLFGLFGLRKKTENEVVEGQLPLSFKKCYYKSEVIMNVLVDNVSICIIV